MIIKAMTIEDYDEVYKLWIDTVGMGIRILDDSKEGIIKFLKRNPHTCFVAVDEKEIVGVIMAGNDGRRAYIYHTVVRIKNRRQGIAAKLVKRCLKAIKNEGINKVALVAFKDNELGNEFWQSQGFSSRDDLVYRDLSLNKENI